MSVVAWDGKTLAVDRQCSQGGIKYECQKATRVIQEGRIYYVGYVGDLSAGIAMAKWFERGGDIDQYPMFQQDSGTWLIVVDPMRRRLYAYSAFPAAVEVAYDKPQAWGCGAPIAMGAMYAGACARRAVDAAIALDTDCGFGIDAFDAEAIDG